MIDESKRDKRNDEIKQTSGFCKLNKSHNYQPRLFDCSSIVFLFSHSHNFDPQFQQ